MQRMWTTFVLVSSLVSTVHFSFLFGRVLTLKSVQLGQA